MADAANSLIAAAAKRELLPLGLIRKGRSRTWIDDHGWWTINVEFQPSSHAAGCYLNVGEQHLWVIRNHTCFENMERPLGGSAFVPFTGDAATFTVEMALVTRAAVEAVLRRRESHGEGHSALSRLVGRDDDLNAGIAAALLGETVTAERRLTGRIHQSDRGVADTYLGLTVPDAHERAETAIKETRSLLRLPTLDAAWW